MSAPSLASYIVKRPFLKRWMMPIAQWYTDASGYRRLGLKADDLIPEENDVVQKALKRLPPKEAYDRIFRIRRAFQCSISHTLLPAAEQTKPEEVSRFPRSSIRQLSVQFLRKNASANPVSGICNPPGLLHIDAYVDWT
ncbi:ubiquinol-cytochrome C reductase complex 14kD subunit-domain-containing protein [Aspergillus welwitschiae]|uniref:Complex III subunit 7 n=1 Tax=Aspergillus welwitschiae TaxID=1341132 RepID=A0A3F3Q4V3_9EURO|nr:ubiquinol-cytochrome C reductase complex 14kD subunit-domain-containing protein [Aspergillus welwitschiae]RDH34198.1 ubiquinol-cytochrome C reductase complex 14kD subunit-domain-containing protein [Aspergillus welwitschiae]